MTKTRQRLALLLAAALLFTGLYAPAGAVIYRYWTDPKTGFAMAGYDPVAYFIEQRPVLGEATHEYVWRDVPWRFASAANRAVFMESPQVYAPQYGGYSVVGVARGYPSQGNPYVWAIEGKRLYLFHSPAHKAVWQQDPKGWIEKASENWPQMQHRLAP